MNAGINTSTAEECVDVNKVFRAQETLAHDGSSEFNQEQKLSHIRYVRNRIAIAKFGLKSSGGLESTSTQHENIQCRQSLLYTASGLNLINTVFILVVTGMVDVNGMDENGDTALHLILKNPTNFETLDMHRLLLSLGANHAITDKVKGNNCLHLLASLEPINFNPKLLIAMLKMSCNYQELIQQRNFAGFTCTDLAKKTGNSSFVRVIIDFQQYTTFPKWFPHFMGMFGVFAPYICLWMYKLSFTGVISIFICFSMSRVMSQSIIYSSYLPFTMGTILAGGMHYFMTISRFCSMKMNLFVMIYSIVIFYTVYKAHTTKVEYLRPDEMDR